MRAGSSGTLPGRRLGRTIGAEVGAEAAPGSRPDAGVGWPGWARTVVTLVLLFHLAAVLAGALGVPPSSELEQAIADGFSPYFDLMDLGYSYRFYAEPPPTPVVTATIQYRGRAARGDGPAAGAGCARAPDAAPAAARPGQCAVLRRPGGQAAGQGRQPEPAGPGLCPASLPDPSRLPERDPARPAAPDPRPGPGARRRSRPPDRRGSTCSAIGCSPRPNGSETSRATTSERGPELPRRSWWGRSGGDGTPSSSRPADPTALGLIRVATGLLAFWSLLVFGLDLHDYFGSEGWAEPSAIRAAQRSLTWSFWFLVPDGGLRLAWLGCLVVLALYTLGLFSRMDGRAGLGDRGLDRPAGAGRAVRVRPGDLAADALPGGDGGQRAGGVAGSVPAAMAAGPGGRGRAGAAGAGGPAVASRPTSRRCRCRRSRPTWRSG